MNKLLYAFITVIVLSSCTKSYYIQGSSNVSNLDGRKLYLKGGSADTLITIDSCDVVHGEFAFKGNLDSVQIVQVFMDDMSLQLPVVLEEGDIILKLDNTQQRVSGTPLNDKLNAFWKNFTQLRNQYVEIDHEEGMAIMNGQDEEATNMRLIKKALKVYANTDKLFTNFVTENFDNPLAPWGFLTRVTYDMTPDAYPIWMNDYLYVNAISQLSSWVEYIMAKAPEKFKTNGDVKNFYEYYQRMQSEMNGTAAPQEEPAPMAGTPQSNVSVPTPAQVAGDSVKAE